MQSLAVGYSRPSGNHRPLSGSCTEDNLIRTRAARGHRTPEAHDEAPDNSAVPLQSALVLSARHMKYLHVIHNP